MVERAQETSFGYEIVIMSNSVLKQKKTLVTNKKTESKENFVYLK